MSLLLAYLLYYFPINSAAPALVYRLERCSESDRAAIASAFSFLFGGGGVWDIKSYSILLQHHITFSEMWDHPDFEGVDLHEYFTEIAESAYVAKNLGHQKLGLSGDWPRYWDTAHDDSFAQSATPLLMLQGGLDPATTAFQAERVGAHFDGPHQHYLLFPDAPHGVSSSTPLSADEHAEHCGQRLLLDFLGDPRAELDSRCIDQVMPIDFRGTEELSQALLGTDDLWDDPIGGSARSQPTHAAPIAQPLRDTPYARRLRASLRQLPAPPFAR